MEGMNIANISNGALVERANEKIQEALNNIMDLNTPAEKKRKVIITLEFEGTEDRDIADVYFDVKFTPIPARKLSTRIVFEQIGNGNVVAEEMYKGAAKGQVFVDSNTGEIVEPKAVSKIVNIK